MQWGRDDKMLLGSGAESMAMNLGVLNPSLPLQLNPSSLPGISVSGGLESHQQHQVMLNVVGMQGAMSNMGSAMIMGTAKKDDRIPQWSFEETKEFIAIRAEFEKDFTNTKRNKTLWENIAARMKEKGYKRSSEQCKCKWKNLVNRYKGKETSDPETGRQCPFFEELDAIFKERAKNMERMLLQSEGPVAGSQPKKKLKRPKAAQGERSSEDYSEDYEDEEEESEDERAVKSKKRKNDRERQRVTAVKAQTQTNNMQEVLQDFFQQQQRIEMQWRESVERREQERRMVEQEWRQVMEKLERERLIMEQAWREREEQRRIREEGRSEKRDALLNSLINRLLREDP